MPIDDLIALLQEIRQSSPRVVVLVPRTVGADYAPVDLAQVRLGRAWRDSALDRYCKALQGDPAEETVSAVFLA